MKDIVILYKNRKYYETFFEHTGWLQANVGQSVKDLTYQQVGKRLEYFRQNKLQKYVHVKPCMNMHRHSTERTQ